MKPQNANIDEYNIPTDTLVEKLLDGILIVDTYGIIIYANKAAQELFRLHSGNLVGKNFGYSVTPYEIQEIQVIQGGKTIDVQLLATIIKWNRKNVFLMSLRDVSEKKKLEEQILIANRELKLAQEKLQQLNIKLEDKVEQRTLELEQKNRDLDAYAKQLQRTYEDTETKVKFRNRELEVKINELKEEVNKLRRSLRSN